MWELHIMHSKKWGTSTLEIIMDPKKTKEQDEEPSHRKCVACFLEYVLFLSLMAINILMFFVCTLLCLFIIWFRSWLDEIFSSHLHFLSSTLFSLSKNSAIHTTRKTSRTSSHSYEVRTDGVNAADAHIQSGELSIAQRGGRSVGGSKG